MKTVKKIMRWLFVLLIIFGIGAGAGYGAALFSNHFERPETNHAASTQTPSNSRVSQEFEPSIIDQLTPAPENVDYQLIEQTIIQLVNDLRVELGVGRVEPNHALSTAAYIRAEEIETSFSHARPD